MADFDYSQGEGQNSEYMVFLKEGQSCIRSSDSTLDLYRSTATQTSIKTINSSTQYEQIDDTIKVTANILVGKYFVGDERKKKIFIMSYMNVVSSIILLADIERK